MRQKNAQKTTVWEMPKKNFWSGLNLVMSKAERFSERAQLSMWRGCESSNLKQLKSNVKLPKFASSEIWLTGQRSPGHTDSFGCWDGVQDGDH